jgi:hypothetical protein
MNWIRVARNIGSDVRVGRVARACGIRRAEAVGLIVNVLTHLPDEARDGDLRAFESCELEEWAAWEGDPGAFTTAFLAHMCTPDCVVRSWEKHNGAAIRDADKARERMQRARAERARAREMAQEAPERSGVCSAHGPRTGHEAPERSHLRDGTGRDVLTTTALTATNSGGAVPAPPGVGTARRRTRKAAAPVKWPQWSQAVRATMHDRWRSRLGDVPYPQWVAALGPVFGSPPPPWTFAQLAAAYDSWLSSVASGGASSPFVRRNPAACASVLSAIAQINDTVHPDDPERLASIDRLVHGRAV